jgi:hypothetical protein
MKTATETLSEILTIGGKFTIFRIGETMAMTNKIEITVKRYLPDGRMVYTPRGERAECGMKLEWSSYQNGPKKVMDGAIFAGWDLPITCDTDNTRPGKVSNGCTMRQMRGNALFNFVGETEFLRKYITEKQLSPLFDKPASIGINENDCETVLFPDEYKGGHAVLDRMLAI